MRSVTALGCTLALVGPLVGPLAMADDLGFDGEVVLPDCEAMSDWYDCRDVDTLDPENRRDASILRGFEYMHNTSSSLGPFGNVKYPDGSPYTNATTACSSCHFAGGQVPFGTPVYQSPAKYLSLPYFGPLGYRRDLEDSIIDCFRNCMNADRSPTKDDPVMRDLVSYIEWIADGITVEDYPNTPLPPEAGPGLPVLASVGNYANATVVAEPTRGERLYNAYCADCHDMDPDKVDRAGLTVSDGPNGKGQGDYRVGDDRPEAPALWGLRDGHSTAAAFYRVAVLGAYIQKHMPFEDAGFLTDQDSLDISAYINAADKDDQRLAGQAGRMYCFNAPDGIPAALRKAPDWLVGCEYRNENNEPEPFSDEQIRNGPWAPIVAWRQDEIARLQSSATGAPVATSDPPSLDLDGADAITTPQGTALTLDVLANDTDPTNDMLGIAEVIQVFPPTADVDVNIGGTVTYTPPAGYSGEGGFVYRVTDTQGLWSNYATVLIAVQP